MLKQSAAIEVEELGIEGPSVKTTLLIREKELHLRIEEAICRYDGRILIGGEPKDAAEWAVREVSVWLRSPKSNSEGNSLKECVEDMVTKARKSPNSVDKILREMVGRRVMRKTGGV